jgi:uncharacterized protein YbcI
VQYASNERRQTQGEMEASVCAELSRFEQEHLGRGPRSLEATLQQDLLVVRMQGVLTAAEQHLISAQPAGRGRDLVKQMRTQLIENASPLLSQIIERLTGAPVRSLHHDISTVTGEELITFVLAHEPHCRERRRH